MIWRTFLDLLYPRSCGGCEGELAADEQHLCWECTAGMMYVQPPYCALCGDPVDGRVDGAFTCYLCGREQPHFDQARSAARHRGVLRQLLHDFKYRDALWLEKDLVRLLEVCVRTHYNVEEIDAVACVPLHRVKRRERGFNQAELLARGLSRVLRKPVLSHCLVRTRATGSQTNLTARERATNVRHAFRTRWGFRLGGRRILLVDDVMTTGATVSDCARALKEGGASKVVVATIARG